MSGAVGWGGQEVGQEGEDRTLSDEGWLAIHSALTLVQSRAAQRERLCRMGEGGGSAKGPARGEWAQELRTRCRGRGGYRARGKRWC